jgi:hypothetical protein
MVRRSSIIELGSDADIHLLELEMSRDLLGGLHKADPFDSARIKNIGNLLKRVTAPRSLAGDWALGSVREGGAARIRWAFLSSVDAADMANLVGASLVSAEGWASRRYVVLDERMREVLESVANPADTRGPGRRARERALKAEGDRSLLWDR